LFKDTESAEATFRATEIVYGRRGVGGGERGYWKKKKKKSQQY